MSLSDNDHVCPICLESIFQNPFATDDANANSGRVRENQFHIGATVPCGHLFHHNCFASWTASRDYGPVKCPTCNVTTEKCVRIYLDPSSLKAANDEDDDISLSSNDCDEDEDECSEQNEEESDDDDKCEEEDSVSENNGSGNANENDGSNDNNDDEENISENDGNTNADQGQGPLPTDPGNDNIVDLTQSPQHSESQVSCASRPSSSKHHDSKTIDAEDETKVQRLARIAKRFKRQFLQKNAQFKEQYSEKQKIFQRVRKAEDDLAKVKSDLNTVQITHRNNQLQLDEARLSLERIRKERELLRMQFSMISQQKVSVDAELEAVKSHYAKELEKERAKTMSEVQQILDEHPVVVEENRVLKQRLQKLKMERLELSRSSSVNKSNTTNITKALRQMDNEIRSHPSNATFPPSMARKKGTIAAGTSLKSTNHASEKPKASKLKIGGGQYSSLASRMISGSRGSKRSSQSAVVRDILSEPCSQKKTKLSSTSLNISQNKRLKVHSASRRNIFQRKI